jgi:signal peptidase I
MKVYNKMKWALGILLVFIIVLITNLYIFQAKKQPGQ